MTVPGQPSFPTISATELRAAIDAGHLDLAFQPKIMLATGAVVGVEALSRWEHPALGRVPPSLFIPMAERCGLIDDLTRRMLSTALHQWSDWNDAGLVLDIAVNISALSFHRPNFPDEIEALCQEHRVPCRHLIVELTESATLHVVQLMDAMTRLRLKGIKISLDDYGTGYSSLMQLHQLPFNEIKIDRSFVHNADRSRDSRIIVKSIIDLAHNLELDVTAEGIETPPILELLTDLGCDQAQGYLLGKPMAGSDLLPWFEQREPIRRQQVA